jgi:hypothetical protein
VIGWSPTNGCLLPLADGPDRVLDLRPLLQHSFPVGSSDVVQVNVHRESRKLEDEHVERCSPFEHEPIAEIGMATKRVEEVQEPDDFLERLSLKASLVREPI